MTFTFNVSVVDGQKLSISTLDSTNTVEDIKKKICEMAGVPTEMIVLIHQGRRLENSKTLAESNIDAGKTISMVVALRAGCM